VHAQGSSEKSTMSGYSTSDQQAQMQAMQGAMYVSQNTTPEQRAQGEAKGHCDHQNSMTRDHQELFDIITPHV
jgi:hypothetical protein